MKIDIAQENKEILNKYRALLRACKDKTNAKDKKDIDDLKLKMREKGFKGAFVVAFYQGNKISIKEALSLQKK